jgi:hypothetical protein
MTRYYANRVTRDKNAPISTGFDTADAAKAQAVFLATTYGGVAYASTNTGEMLGRYSARRGWH